MRSRYFLTLYLLLGISTLRIFAQETMDNLQLYELQDTIVVVADRFKLPLKQITYTHDVIPGEQVKHMSRHSALEMVDIIYPSAYILDNKILGYGVGREGAGIINIRGQGGKPNTGILVLLNGHPDFMGIFGHPLPDVYGMDDVEQVEVLAGPTSSVFGSQAMGGVINIKTAPDYDHMLNLSIIGGSHKTYNLGLNLARKFNNHGFFITLRQKHTDGHIKQTSFESSHYQAGWQWYINPHWQISAQGRYVPYEFDDPSRTSDPAELGTYGKIRRGTGEVILENRDKLIQGSTQVYGNWGDHRFYDGFKSNDFTYGISSYQQLKIANDLNFALGGDFIYYGGQAENNLLPPGVVDGTYRKFTSAGAYALAMYNVFPDLSLKFGLRYQYNSLPLQNFAPVAGLTYNIFGGLIFYANYQSGFRFPTLNELYLFPTSNPDLKEENIRGIESGIWYYWGAKNSLRLTVFNNYVKNLITNPRTPPPGQFVNSGEARQTGVETQVTYAIFSNLGIQLSYSFLNPDQITAYNPKHQIKYLLNFYLGNFRSTLYGKYIDHLYADNYHQSRLNDYNLINLALTYTFISSWEFNLKLINLLDRRYEVQPEFPAPRFYFMAGFDFRL